MHSEAQWLVSELLRTVSGLPMAEAGKLVQMVQAPVGGLVEDHAGRKLVVETMSSREEVLVLLRHDYPNPVPLKSLAESMNRFSAKTVGNTLRKLWGEKVVDGNSSAGYRLTSEGFAQAIEVVNKHLAS